VPGRARNAGRRAVLPRSWKADVARGTEAASGATTPPGAQHSLPLLFNPRESLVQVKADAPLNVA
jgi:hypothetical protein